MRRSKAFNLANLLTYGRLVAVPAVVGLLYWPEDHWSRWFALGVFALAAITDYLDGYVARTYAQGSALLTLYTGWDYLKTGIQHLVDEG